MTEKKLEILVVEDDARHIESAKQDLSSEGNLTIVSTYRDAITYLSENHPDVVITDERIPFAERFGTNTGPLNPDAFTGKPLPLGSKVVLYCIAKKVPYVALISDTNHHLDEIAATQDHFSALCSKQEGNYLGIQLGNTMYVEHSDRLCPDGRKLYLRTVQTLLQREGGFRTPSRESMM